MSRCRCCSATNMPASPPGSTALAARPTLLLVPQGPAQQLVRHVLGPSLQLNALRALLLDWLPHAQFDRLLWSADLNVVRGEDSLVRALWAGAPFIWQLYPQHDGAHRRKLQAFLERWQARWRRRTAGGGDRGVRLVECDAPRPADPGHLGHRRRVGARPCTAGVQQLTGQRRPDDPAHRFRRRQKVECSGSSRRAPFPWPPRNR